MNKSGHHRMSGFTIIEVLIVLAIAGLIILIVFLAVPALQRNNRNTQRHNDAARVGPAFQECLTNNRQRLTSCNDPTKMLPYLDLSKNLQLTAISMTGTPSTDEFAFMTNSICNDSNTAAVSGGGPKSFAILYQIEGTSGPVDKCLEGN